MGLDGRDGARWGIAGRSGDFTLTVSLAKIAVTILCVGGGEAQIKKDAGKVCRKKMSSRPMV